jgi:hypothetical protein
MVQDDFAPLVIHSQLLEYMFPHETGSTLWDASLEAMSRSDIDWVCRLVINLSISVIEGMRFPS